MELIKIQENDKGQKLVSARDLYKFLDAKERFNSWFERQLQFGFIENQDFIYVKGFAHVGNGGEREVEDVALTLDCAKEISMVQRSEKGKQARQYFIECEKQLKEVKPIFQVPTTFKEALLLAVEQQEKIEQLELQTKTLEIELDKSHEWITIKKIAHANKIDWKSLEYKKLKDVSIATGYLPKKVFDANFPNGVNAYHISAWKIVYPNLKY